MKETLLLFLRGLLMGTADVIPGVSGGTIAFITGIYPRLIHALSRIDNSFLQDILQGHWKTAGKKIDLKLFLPLGAGIGLAIFFLSGFMKYFLETVPGITFSFFMGLILASSVLLMRRVGRWTFEKGVMIAFGVVGAYLLTGFSSLHTGHSLPFIFFSGMLAICAMILPGISGAFILVLLGQYYFLITALHEYHLSVIGTFLLGALTGLLLFSKFLDYLLHKFRKLTLAFLTGMMVGSLRIPWQEITASTESASGLYLAGIVGFVLVYGIEKLFSPAHR